MQKLRWSCLLVVLSILIGCASPAQDTSLPEVDSGYKHADSVAILGGRIVDVKNGTTTENQGLLAVNGRFLTVDAELSEQTLADAEVVELSDDQYILPGLVDLHAHYNMDLLGDGRVDETTYNPLIYLANGVTSTFPAGAYDPEKMLEARRRIDRGEQVGPRLLTSGPYFGRTNPEWENEDVSTEDIYEMVDRWAARGAEGFKAKGISPEHLEPLVRRAHQHGLTVTGHLGSGARNTVNSREAIQMGIDRVEHILGGDVLDPQKSAYPVWNEVDTTSEDFRATVDRFLDHQVYFDATITAPVYFANPDSVRGFDYWVDEQSFFTPHVQEIWKERRADRTGSELMENLYGAMRRTTKAFHDAGGDHLITLGTDKPSWGDYLAGFSAHREMHAMVMAGLPEASVLRIATQNGANAIGKGSLLGSVEPGKLADLFVVQGNPLEDITHTRNVQVVMKSGRLYDPENLLEPARGNIGPEGPDEHEAWSR